MKAKWLISIVDKYKKYSWFKALITNYEIAKKKWWFIYAIALLFLIIFVVYFDIKYKMFGDSNNISNIVSEVNGIVFDFVLFGIVLRIYEINKEKKAKIENLFEELDDYKYWEGEESTYRRIGIIKRLMRYGVTNINLTKHIFRQGKFVDMVLDKLQLSSTKFYDCGFQGGEITKKIDGCKFNKCTLSNIKFNDTTVAFVDFDECQLTNIHFLNANFSASELVKSKLRNCIFENCDLDASFKDSTVYGDSMSFKGCNFKYADLDGLFFPFLRRDDLIKKFRGWIGDTKTEAEILDKYSIVNLDDPSPYEAPQIYPIGTRVPSKQPSLGCSLRKIPKGVQKINPFT